MGDEISNSCDILVKYLEGET